MFERFTEKARQVVVDAEALAVAAGDKETALEHLEKSVHRTIHPPFTDELKKVLEYSLREALSAGCNYVGPEHILSACKRVKAARNGG